jgi:putative membrane protein
MKRLQKLISGTTPALVSAFLLAVPIVAANAVDVSSAVVPIQLSHADRQAPDYGGTMGGGTMGGGTMGGGMMGGGMMDSGMMGGGMMDGGMMVLQGLFWLLLLGFLVFGIVLLVRTLQGGSPSRPERRSALDVLDNLYARGEIGRKEYLERKQDLS